VEVVKMGIVTKLRRVELCGDDAVASKKKGEQF